ncbi:MAG: N-acetylmuramoyl-L-alanine amidase [Planctomycetota bacterium]
MSGAGTARRAAAGGALALLALGALAAQAEGRPGAFLGARFEADDEPAALAEVVSGSPAAAAGLRAGDRLLGLDGARLSGKELAARLRLAYPGQRWTLRAARGFDAFEATVQLGPWAAHWRQHPAPRAVGDAVLLAGQPVPIGAPVVTWRDPRGHDGYQERCAFSDQVLPRRPAAGCNEPCRYGVRRNLDPAIAEVVSARGALTRDLAAAQIDQVVIHYDVAWTSRNCFLVLHDLRGLSCHFLLDVDGTLYQTLDLVERARHAGGANDRAIGIEIAHPGPLELTKDLAARYQRDAEGVRFDLGRLQGDVRTPGFVVRPARPEPVAGLVQGRRYTMYDYTDAQYRTLTRLLAALSKALPRIRLAVPRDAAGQVRTAALSAEELQRWSGLLGHYHVTRAKQDPGPSFDWERVLREARALRH